MSRLRSIHLASLEELCAAAADWDDLWWRTETALPTARAEMLTQWVEHFNPRGSLHVLAVAEENRWIAALPLVSNRLGRLIPVGGLPCNPWASGGELLLDPAADAEAAFDVLLAAVGELPWPLLWLNDAVPEAAAWRALLRACDRAAVPAACHKRFRVGRVRIDPSWDSYRKRLPKNHRQGIARAAKRLASEGDVRYEMHSRLDAHDVEPWLREAFELEDRGWKGDAGTSVLRAPGMFRFYVRQAEHLARWGQLETAALRLDGPMAAFVYGFRARDTYFAYKISYDPALAAYSPGQLLFGHILEQLHNVGDVRALDFVGPMNQALSQWRPETYGIGRVVLAKPGFMGRATMYAYKQCWRRWRQRQADATNRFDEHAATRADRDSVLEPAGMPE